MNGPGDKLLLSIPEAAALLGVSRSTLYVLIASGAIRTKLVGRRRLIPRSALEAFCRK